MAGDAQRGCSFALLELKRQHTHPDEIASVDALVAFGNHRFDAHQKRPFGSPVSRRTRTILLASEHDEWRTFFLVAHGGVVDEHLLAARHMDRVPAFDARHELVLDTDVRERAPQHHPVVTAARTVGVEILFLQSTLAQVASRRRVVRNIARG